MFARPQGYASHAISSRNRGVCELALLIQIWSVRVLRLLIISLLGDAVGFFVNSQRHAFCLDRTRPRCISRYAAVFL